ncbi:MAG TPA: leucine-rich repeat domain-containing protein, partial [Clostridiales bacterium]|nr:leucine-rich repeat domain-containing protein [Clostridiales bacterium]
MKRQIKRVIAGVLAVATLFLATPIDGTFTNPLTLKSNFTVSAETYGDLTYEIVDGKISITGCDESATDVVIPSEIDGLPVTSISSLAFSWCKELTSIKIPGSVTSIGGQAFFLCESLTEIAVDEDNQYFCDIDRVLFNKDKTTIIAYPLGKTSIEYEIPDSVTRIGKDAFAQHSSLTSVTIPDSVTSIEEGAFMNCLNLNSIAIPNLVFNIGYLAFWGCYGLTSIMVGEDNQYYSDIDGVLFSKDETTLIQYPSSNPLELYDVSDSVTSIGYSAFSHCSNLTSITVPNSVTSIGGLAFSYCSSLTSITMPDSVTDIGENAFSECSSLKSITIPDSITEIRWGVFNNCSSLESITIPDSVINISGGAFKGCSSLTSITIPDAITEIEWGMFSDCSSLISITIPDSVVRVGAWAFSHCTYLTSITIPNSISIIEEYAFYGCSNLTSITVPDSVTSIGDNAFNGCLNLKTITIPASVTSIGDNAFDSNYLRTIYGYTGSAAETYANEKGITFIALDGEFRIGDLTYQVVDGEVSITECDSRA